jgi:hypothetical protein
VHVLYRRFSLPGLFYHWGTLHKKVCLHLVVLEVLEVLNFHDADKRLGYAGQFFSCTKKLLLLHQKVTAFAPKSYCFCTKKLLLFYHEISEKDG